MLMEIWTAPWPSAESPFPSPKKTASTAVIVGEHGDQHGAAACVGQAFGDLGAFGRQRLRLGARAVVDGDAMSRLDEVPRHRLTHLAKTDKTDVHLLSCCSRAEGRTRSAGDRAANLPPIAIQRKTAARTSGSIAAPSRIDSSVSTAGFVARRHICRCCRK